MDSLTKLRSCFNFSINNSIEERMCAIGKFDGKHPSLVTATSTGNIIVSNPHKTGIKKSYQKLSLNQKITALNTSDLKFAQCKNRDSLIIGTNSSFLVYDVERNNDLVFHDFPDSLNCLLPGYFGARKEPIIIIGGNCNIQAFDNQGNEVFWTVAGDNVRSLCLFDMNGDDENELIVGSDDFELRVFKEEHTIYQSMETGIVTCLCPLQDTKYGYSVDNGTVGVYQRKGRIWATKSKVRPTHIFGFDVNSDGKTELCTGWSNGYIDVRDIDTGDVIFYDQYDNSIAALQAADFRLDGRTELIAATTNGNIIGYLPFDEKSFDGQIQGVSPEESRLTELLDNKQSLLAELKRYEDNIRQIKLGKSEAGVIPSHTQLDPKLEVDPTNGCLNLTISVTHDTIIKSVILFADNVFDGESLVIHPKIPKNTINIQLRPKYDVFSQLLIKAIVGYPSTIQDHVFELTHDLPKFGLFYYVHPKSLTDPGNSVTFHIPERLNRVIIWLNACFNVEYDSKSDHPIDHISVGFKSLRDDAVVIIKAKSDCQFVIKASSMELAGTIIQDLTSYLKITELDSYADFPREIEEFSKVLKNVEDYNNTRLSLQTGIADVSNTIKTLVIKAEDARILNNFTLMKSFYSELYKTTQELLGEFQKRTNNQTRLLDALKDVHRMIMKASHLRVGVYKENLIKQCRESVKKNNITTLINLIRGNK